MIMGTHALWPLCTHALDTDTYMIDTSQQRSFMSVSMSHIQTQHNRVSVTQTLEVYSSIYFYSIYLHRVVPHKQSL